MPLSSDPKLLSLSKDLIAGFDKVNGGVHPGFRPAHAKGLLLKGSFTPTPEAASLSSAPHFKNASTPVTVRFSDFAGIPTVSDNDPQFAGPRGIGLRFNLAEHVHTDIVAHSVDAFPVNKAEDFLEFLNALIATDPNGPHPNAIEQFLGAHPAALAFVQMPKPFPVSFATEHFFAVSAFKFTNADGVSRFGRYRILPSKGTLHISNDEAATKSKDYLFDEIKERITKEPVKHHIVVQLAEEGDETDDATVRWPETRSLLTLGEITLTAIEEDNAAEQQKIIFDPIPRLEGIEASADPLFEPRANVYLVSGRRRRVGGTEINI